MVTARDVQQVLEERPDLEPAIEAVLKPSEPWTFDDVDVDSGAFGELVSRDIVEKSDEGYRVTNRSAVQQALSGETAGNTEEAEFDFELPDIDKLEAGLLLGGLLMVVAFRVISYPRVFRDGYVVLSGNDPYYYRYWIDLLLTDPQFSLSNLPDDVTKGEPLMVATLWFMSLLAGGTPEIAGLVLAWYPVLFALITATLLYFITNIVTDDRRIGLAAITMLAVLPGHAMRTSLGFADHHAFDHAWLVLTLLGIVLVVSKSAHEELTKHMFLLGTSSLVLGISGQVLAWQAGPLLILPLGGYLAIDSLRSVHQGKSPLPTSGPVLLGVGLAAVLTWVAHLSLGWHTTLVASAPLMLTFAGIGVVTAGELAYRYKVSPSMLAVIEGFVVLFGAFALRTIRPEFWNRLTRSVTVSLLERRPIAEVQSLFGESIGWLLLFGLLLFLAVPYMAWASQKAVDDARWLAPVVYGWYFFGLSIIQVRFVGELSPVLAIFAGLGFVHLAERVDIARRPAPFTNDGIPELTIPNGPTLRALLVLFLLVASLSIIQVPLKTSQITVPQDQYETTIWMAEYSDEQDLSYPQNYVFSDWSWNRLYNYFVNGESQSYKLAQRRFGEFVTSPESQRWFEYLDGRAGFVVTTPRVVTNESNIGTRLHRNNGSRASSVSGLAHYRLQFVSEGGQYKVFTLVEGAVITGKAEPNEMVKVQTRVQVGDSSFTYVRQTTADAAGNFAVRVAHPGTYTVQNGTIRVSESAIKNGTSVSAGSV